MSETQHICLSFPAPIPQGHTVEVRTSLARTFIRDINTNITYGNRAEVKKGVIVEPEGEPEIERGIVTRARVVRSSRGDTPMVTNIWIRPLAESEGTCR